VAIVSKCSRAECNEGEECLLGEIDRATCKHWETIETVIEKEAALDDCPMAPWHGDAFSKSDINLLSVQRRPHIIALIGPHNAGKTTYLSAIHLLCLRQPLLSDHCFAGSFTLRGWQKIIHRMEYPREKNLPPGYPPHTPNSNERVPSLLHYSLRNMVDDSLQNVIFTDAPGEWFTSWASNPDESVSPGAVWTVRNADTYLFFVDSEELASENAGVARGTIESMACRLREEGNEKPVGIIWSKSDIAVDAIIKEQIEEILTREMPHATSFHTSVKSAKDKNTEFAVSAFTDSLQFALTKKPVACDFRVDFQSGDPTDRFLCYRGGDYG